MLDYDTLDHLPDLPADNPAPASLIFRTYVENGTFHGVFDNIAESYAGIFLTDLAFFAANKGATYSVLSESFFDPDLLKVYDHLGNAIAADEENTVIDPSHALRHGFFDFPDASYDVVTFVAPYTGKYFVDADWQQGSTTDEQLVSLKVYEDLDTIPASDIDRIYDWGESQYTELLPEHQRSVDNVFGYYARLYSNGNALGEKNDNLYFYSAETDQIILLGTTSDFIETAELAGF